MQQTPQPQQPVSLHPRPQKVARFSRKFVVGVSLTGALLLSTALVFGLILPEFQRAVEHDPAEPSRYYAKPDSLNDLPIDYAAIRAPALPPDPVVRPDSPDKDGASTERVQRRQPTAEDREREKQLAAERDAARKSGIFFDQESPASAPTQVASAGAGERREATAGAGGGAVARSAAGGRSDYAAGLGGGGDEDDQNRQHSKIQFLEQNRGIEEYLDEPYRDPLSPYEVKAGTVIPAALVTAINSDLPGDIIGMVTEPVYDTVSGNYELIPQGAKLYGRYDSVVAYGQSRALVVWQRLIMPNGKSIKLDGMVGTDQRGQSGLADGVDYHLKEAGTGIALSTVIALAGNLAGGSGGGYYGPESLMDTVGNTVAQESARVGQQITRRMLNRQPTITIREGFPLRIMVNNDMVLEPYQ